MNKIIVVTMAVAAGLMFGLLSLHVQGAQVDWGLYNVNPWIEADANTLPGMLKKQTNKIDLSGPRNDWLTGAIAVSAIENTAVTVRLEESPKLRGRITLKVVGQLIEREHQRVIWDPLLSTDDIKEFAKGLVNFEQVKDFPLLHITPDLPAFLWITVDLRGVESGNYIARLTFRDKKGGFKAASINIEVLDAELPVKSPLHCLAWQWARDDMIQDFLEHGVDVAYRDHEKWWDKGAGFLLFQFGPTFSRKPLDDERKAEIKKELDDIYALVDKLKVPRNKWALYIADEPSDGSSKIDAQNAAYIKRLRPGTQIYTNPAWGMLADKNQNSATLDGTIKVLNQYTDIWCPYIWHMWDGSGVYKYLKSTKKPLWFYEIYTQAANQRPSVGRDALRMLAWNAWRYDAKGIGMFSANDVANNWWRDLDPKSNGYANYSFTYPGANGIMSSRAFEALRQGIQEHKRLFVLRSMEADSAILDVLVSKAFVAAEQKDGALLIDSIRSELDKMLVLEFQKQNNKK